VEKQIDSSGLTKYLDFLKERYLRSKDYYKFIIGLSTGALVFSITFIEKYGAETNCKSLMLMGWVCLIVSILAGVWLLEKFDSIQDQWKNIIDISEKPENILFGIERDVGKLVTRGCIDYLLKHEMAKEPKESNEEKIKELRKDWVNANGRIGKAFLQKIFSDLEKIYPSLSRIMPDITKEFEKWEQFLSKAGRGFYVPDILKKLREALIRVGIVEKVMRGFFFAGIILITLFSATNFLEIDIIGLIRRLL
jgi:hypothetical protein